jgi:RNA polymerase sigma-70 factor (ECF subfamily)
MGNGSIEEVYKEYRPKLLLYLSNLAGPHEADDLVQEVFEKASRALADFRGESKLTTWLYRIATNAALDRLRSPISKRQSEHVSLEEGLGIQDRNIWTGQSVSHTDRQVIRKEMSTCVREFVGKLPPDYRTVIMLSEFEGFKNREIAEILQVSLDVVKIRLHRARASLKKELDKGCSFYRSDEGVLACDRKPTCSES